MPADPIDRWRHYYIYERISQKRDINRYSYSGVILPIAHWLATRSHRIDETSAQNFSKSVPSWGRRDRDLGGYRLNKGVLLSALPCGLVCEFRGERRIVVESWQFLASPDS